MALKKLSLVAMVVIVIGGIGMLVSAYVLGILGTPCSWCCFWHPGALDPTSNPPIYVVGADPNVPGPALADGWYGTGIARNLAVGIIGAILGLVLLVCGFLIFWKEKMMLVSGIVAILAALFAFPILDAVYVVASLISIVGGVLALVSWFKYKPFT